jgi:peptide-methionine (S)-S-oxide reductase
VVRTRVGYAGGKKKNPTYYDLGDHSETVQIDFDPAKISYRELLEVFWESHSPTSGSWSRQYMAAVFYHDEEQRKDAEMTRDRIASKIKGEIKTQIVPFTGFYLAEDYHQKHALRRYPELAEQLLTMYPTTEGLVYSTAAARVNGYLAGYGGCDSLKAEVHKFGLSTEGSETLLEIVCGRKTAISCKIG